MTEILTLLFRAGNTCKKERERQKIARTQNNGFSLFCKFGEKKVWQSQQGNSHKETLHPEALNQAAGQPLLNATL